MKFNTVKEIADDYVKGMSKEDCEYLATLTREDMGQFHHGFGTYLRNHYELWHTSPLTEKWRTDESSHDIREGIDYSLDHPDHISMEIIYAIWDKING